MSAAKFTPGAWKVTREVPGKTFVTSDSVSATVATVHAAEVAANARLIAAAPAMAEALRSVLTMIDRKTGAVALGGAKRVAEQALAALQSAGVEP